MSKSIGVIAEDISDVDVVTALLEKYADPGDFKVRRFVGNGCGTLRNKCDSWVKTLFEGGCHHVLIFHDLDRASEDHVRAHLLKKVPPATYPNSLIVIPREEMEAWLLSDERALKEVFSLKRNLRAIRNCEEIKSPKEYLAELIRRIDGKRYLNTVHNKRIAKLATLDRLNACPSFRPLDQYLKESVFRKAGKGVQRTKSR